ncbi:MAG: choice-of-anchor tandem repeat GloVer-containing protein [Candidatus Cybelea sp.]
MKFSGIFAGALVGGALLGGCGGDHGFSLPASATAPAQTSSADTASSEKVLYRFGGGKDGENPESSVIDVSGTLYGVTQHGGSGRCAALNSPPGCGTIFRVNTSGAGYRVLHRYRRSAREGSQPVGGVIYQRGMLYGTTSFGDGSLACQDNGGCGTVFKMDSSGKGYTVLHKFSGTDGFAIYAGVLDRSSTLYGAAFLGGPGSCRCGLVYELVQSGQETVLHSFTGTMGGYEPFFSPIELGGVLYGTTRSGGDTKCANSPSGCGTIYSMSTSGNGYRILYRFKGGSDGITPANVIDVNGVLYGTTAAGGGTSCSGPSGLGCGTIFAIGTSGKGYRVLYRFKGGTDGWNPTSLTTDMKGTLYSATSFGGRSGCATGYGCGTLFEVSTLGNGYNVLYRFKGGMDGANPYLHGPIEVNGTLYGTTYEGGGSGCGGGGCGTVFAVTP